MVKDYETRIVFNNCFGVECDVVVLVVWCNRKLRNNVIKVIIRII